MIPKLPLLPGTYYLTLSIENDREPADVIDQAVSINIHPYDIFESGHLPPRGKGIIFSESVWKAEEKAKSVFIENTILES